MRKKLTEEQKQVIHTHYYLSLYEMGRKPSLMSQLVSIHEALGGSKKISRSVVFDELCHIVIQTTFVNQGE